MSDVAAYGGEDLQAVAVNWLPLSRGTRFMRVKKGYASSNWVFSHKGNKYVLKRYMDFKKKMDLVAEHRISEHVAREGFPHQIPRMLISKSGKPFAESGGALYSLYRFIPGSTGFAIGENDALEIGAIAARLHSIIEKPRFRAKKRSGFQTIERIGERIDRNGAEARGLRSTDAKAFLSACEWFSPALRNLDLSHYETLKTYPVHCDISPDNLIWRRGRISGLLDFSNMARYRDAVLMDLAWAAHHCCVDSSTAAGYDKRLIGSMLKGYSAIRSLTKDDMETLPRLMVVANAFDLEFAYQLQAATGKDQKARMLGTVGRSRWLLRNSGWFASASGGTWHSYPDSNADTVPA